MSIEPVAMAKFSFKETLSQVKQWRVWLPKLCFGIMGIGMVAGLIAAGKAVGPEVLRVVKAHLAKGPAGSVIHAIDNVQKKAQELAESHAENEVLRKENQYLRLELGVDNNEKRSLASERKTKEIGLQLEKETGLKTGRVVETLKYKVPPNLLPQNLYLLGLTYLRDGKNEAAAAIFHFLMNGSDGKTYQTPTNFVLAAIAWFRVDHVDLAESYLDSVLKLSPDSGDEVMRLQAVSRMWMAAIEKKRGNEKLSKKWLHEILDFHPKSLEARWINGIETPGRSLAGEEEKEEDHGAASKKEASSATSHESKGDENHGHH